ncbi:G-protein coupled receptor 84-like [Aulostomus maculatus]
MQLNRTNLTGEDYFSCFAPSVVGYRYVAVLWGCVVAITGTLGNVMTILAFTLDTHLRTRFNVLIVNLAVADLLYCAVLLPISVDSCLHLRWHHSELWCKVFGLLLFLSNSVSVTFLCLLAASRYLLVVKPVLFDRIFSDRGLILLLISAWALGLATSSPFWAYYIFVPQLCICSLDVSGGHSVITFMLFFYIFGGLSCVGTFYVLIHRRVKVASKALLRYRLSQHSSRKKPASSDHRTADGSTESSMACACSCKMSSQGGIICNDTPSKEQAPNASADNKPPLDTVTAPSSPSSVPTTAASSADAELKRVTHMCFAVFMCFTWCFVPFLLINTASNQSQASQVLQMVSLNLNWLNSCINPILYAAMNRQFRQAYRALLTRALAPLTCLWT